MNDKFDEVRSFFARSYSKKSDENTTVNFDLEIMGDDADCFMLEFAEKFSVDLNTFNYADFFHEELGLKYLYYKFFKPEFLLDKKPLTIGHLSEVAVRGVWFDPE